VEQDLIQELKQALTLGIDLSDELVESLSGLTDAPRAQFDEFWRELDADQRVALVHRLAEATEENVVLDFAWIHGLVLADPDPVVRELGLRLAAVEPRRELLDTYLYTAAADPDPDVRVAALEELSAYTLLAGTEDWPAALQQQLETALVGALHLPNAPLAARTAALLSLAYLTTDRSEQEIRQAHLQPDLREAAIEAMGRNCQEIWIPDLLAELEDDDPDLRLAAVQAAAELEDEGLVPRLAAMMHDPDFDVRMAAIAALGTVGGDDAKGLLADLMKSQDKPLRDAARTAIERLLEDEDPFKLM